MRILVLNGSPRPHGNTATMVAVFKESAEAAGHEVTVINICRKNIKGCLACEYCQVSSEIFFDSSWRYEIPRFSSHPTTDN